jgi:hypothetical protein
MSTINLGSPGVRQDFTVQEGTGFTMNFVNSAGNFPAGTCATLTIDYGSFDPSYLLTNTVLNQTFPIPAVFNDNRGTGTTIFTGGKRYTIGWFSRLRINSSLLVRCFTTRPAPNTYNPFKDYSLLTLSDDTISFVLPSDMTTAKKLPETLYTNTTPSQEQNGLTFDQLKDSIIKSDMYWVDCYNYFSMLYVTASYELNVKTPTNAYRPIFGTITKNKSFIANNIPSCE